MAFETCVCEIRDQPLISCDDIIVVTGRVQIKNIHTVLRNGTDIPRFCQLSIGRNAQTLDSAQITAASSMLR